MVSSIEHQYSAISEHSLVKGSPEAIRDWLILSRQDSLVSHFPLQEEKKDLMTKETNGLKQGSVFALYDQNLHSWKTCQESFLQDTSEQFLKKFPKSGTMQNGVCYLRQNWEHRIKEIGSGYSVPTPTANSNLSKMKANTKGPKNLMEVANGKWSHLIPTPDKYCGKRGPTKKYDRTSKIQSERSINSFAKHFPTPQARDWKGKSQRASSGNKTDCLPNAVGGQLNPYWVEWLMGWPIGWTDLKPLEIDKYQQWLESHGNFCMQTKFVNYKACYWR